MIQENKIEKKLAAGDWLNQVDALADQVKMLALNLAISLAKSRKETRDLTFLEPEFTRLVNGSVEVIKEITAIMKAFRNEGKMVYIPRKNSDGLDRIETALNEILSTSQKVLYTINEIKKRKGQVDNLNRT